MVNQEWPEPFAAYQGSVPHCLNQGFTLIQRRKKAIQYSIDTFMGGLELQGKVAHGFYSVSGVKGAKGAS
jgi:hypothetical protein